MNLIKGLNKTITFSFYLLFIIVPLILTPVNFELFEFNKMLTVYFLTVIITATWIIKMVVLKKIIIKRTPFDIPLLLFLFSQIISTILSIDVHTSLWGYYSRFHGGLISTLSYLLLYYAFTANLLNQKRTTRKILLVSLSTAVLVSIYGILEHFGIDKHLWIQDVQNRVFSTLGQPNWLAAYLLTLIPLSIALFLVSKKASPLHLITSVIFFITLLYTKSRSGLAGFSVAYLSFWGLILLKTKSRFPLKKFLTVTIIFLTITLFTETGFTPTFKKLINQPKAPTTTQIKPQPKVAQPSITLGGSSSKDIRNVVWQGAIDVWKAYPIFGSGVETFAYSYYNFRPQSHNHLSEWDFLYNKAHNEFLNFLSTTGIVGLGSYLLIIIWFTLWSIKKALLSKNPQLTAAFIAGFLGLAVSNFFGFSVVPVALFFFLFPAFAFSLTQSSSKPPSLSSSLSPLSNSQYLAITLTIILALFLDFQVIKSWQADKTFAIGKSQVKANQIFPGYLQLQKAVSMQPNEPTFRNEYAEAAAKLAVVYHQQALESDSPSATQAAGFRDQVLNEAITQSDIVISQNSVHLNFYKSRLKIFLLLSEIDEKYQNQALKTFQDAIKLSPTDAKLYYNLGLFYVQIGQPGLAQQILEQTIDLKPNYEGARFALGSLYEQTDQIDLARQQYQYMLENFATNQETVKQKLDQLPPQ